MALNELLEYQQVDGQLRTIEQEIASSEERKKYLQAKKFIENARDKLDVQDRRAAELKNLRDELERRCEEMSRQIDEFSDLEEMVEGGGDATFYKKNAQTLLEHIRAVKADIAKLVSDASAAVEEYKKLKEQTIAMQRQYKEYSEKFKEIKNSRTDEVAKIGAKLETLSKGIPADILAKYKAKRKEGIFPILVPLTNGRCICGMDLSLLQQGNLAGGNVIECEHCRRFIYNK